MSTAESKSARGSFPAKLYELVEGHSRSAQSEEDLVVSWCEGGLAFIVRDLTRFCEEVLPQHFCHNKWASFIRQLNLYGFRRITQGSSSGAYWHKHFQRGQPQLLRGITRARRTGTAQGGFNADDDEDDHAFARQRQLVGGPSVDARPRATTTQQNTYATTADSWRPSQSAVPVGPSSSNGAVSTAQGPPPMHTAVPLPQMPPLQSLASLPPPPIISDEALLRELDSLVQQQRANHVSLAAPSPASSSSSLSRIRGDLHSSPASTTSTKVPPTARVGVPPSSDARVALEQRTEQRSSANYYNNGGLKTTTTNGKKHSLYDRRADSSATVTTTNHKDLSSALPRQQQQPPPQKKKTPPPPVTATTTTARIPVHHHQQQQDDDDTHTVQHEDDQPRSFVFARPSISRPPSGGDYAVGEDLAAAATAISLHNNNGDDEAAVSSSSTTRDTQQQQQQQHQQHTNNNGYRRSGGFATNAAVTINTKPLTSKSIAAPSYHSTYGVTAGAPYETDSLSIRKRIASHQSVHSVGSLDGGSMTEIGGHPLAKHQNNMRTMSKSSLASDDWDLNIADVDSLNLDEWRDLRWNESANNLSRLDSRDFLRPATSLGSFGNGSSGNLNAAPLVNASIFGRVSIVNAAVGGGNAPQGFRAGLGQHAPTPDLFTLGGVAPGTTTTKPTAPSLFS